MANVLALLKPTAQPSMSGFDLSQKHVYSGCPGRIDSPVQIETVPKDHFKINVGSLMRTMTLNTAAFLRGKITFDFYFVPYTQIWHPFNQFIGQRKDVHSALQKGIARCPILNLGDLFRLAYKIHTDDATQTHSLYNVDIHSIPWSTNLFNMLDFLGYGNYYWLKDMFENSEYNDVHNAILRFNDKYINIFRAAAYQHVWYDYYRNKFYDNYEYFQEYNHSDYVLAFNFDDVPCNDFASSIIPIDYTSATAETSKRVISLFTQRYCQYKQDLFQSALPSQQFGAVSSVEFDATLSTGSSIYSIGSDNLTRNYDQNGNPIQTSTDLTNSTLGFVLAGTTVAQARTPHVHNIAQSTSFDVLALKRAEALQKWRQNALRAGNMVDDSFRAHYGVTPRYEQDNVALKLGSFEGSLNINTVQATAENSNAVANGKVGDLGASATAVVEGNEISYDCRDFGVIICMQYFRPESEYNSTMIDKANRLSEPYDFFTEEFQNIGLDTINKVDYNVSLDGVNEVLGYAAQYWWYKQALDKVHQEFAKYTFNRQSPNVQTRITEQFKGDKVFWVAPRDLDFFSMDSSQGFMRVKSTLYVSPNLLDDVFGVAYHTMDTTHNSTVITDNLLFNTYFDIKAVRPMSVIGLPQF